MDKVRLGRALGYGTRHAARTLAAVADAATAPDPSQAKPSEVGAAPASRSDSFRPDPRAPSSKQKQPTSSSRQNITRKASRSLWAPLATFSSALWLRVTGLFFAILALTMVGGAWRLHTAGTGTADAETVHHFWLFAALAALFGYFAVSSFVRATLRERR